MASTGEYI